MCQREFQAELNQLYEMLFFIKSYGLKKSIPLKTLEQVILSCEEAIVNIIKYSYPLGSEGKISIQCEPPVRQEGIRVILKDKGSPFNPLEKTPTIPPSPRIVDQTEKSLGGYGIHIFIELMDVVEYERLPDGNMLTLIKYTSF